MNLWSSKAVAAGGQGFTVVTHQEDLIGTFTERGIIGAVHWCLAGELGVKLTDIIGRLLPKELSGKGHIGHCSVCELCCWFCSGRVKDELTRKGLNGGSTLRERRSSQFICRKNGWACGQQCLLEYYWLKFGLLFNLHLLYCNIPWHIHS